MKRCPQCNRVETDDTLVFCRTDGTPLVTNSSSVSGAHSPVKPGSALSEIETSILPHATDAEISRSTAPSTVLDASRSPARTRELRRGKSRKVIVLAIACVIVVALAFSIYFYRTWNDRTVIDSVAVLPFQNASGNPNMDYLSDGVTESVINSLSRLSDLKVMARSTMFRFKGRESDPQKVGQELGVSAVMTGRMLQRGDELVVNVELVNVADGTQLWGEQYNRRSTDLASLQQQIARDISEHLRLKLSGREQQLNKGGTSDTEAYQSYLRGRYFWNKRTADGLRKAIEQFQQAIERDPNYALAYAGLADSYLLLEQYAGTPASETLPKAKVAATHALRIDESLAEAHTSLAFYYSQTWQWDESEKEFKRAISLNPNYPTAHQWYQSYLRAQGRFDEAMSEIKRARELDPLSPILGVNLAIVYIRKGDLDSAMAEAIRLRDLEPNFPLSHAPLGKVYIKQRKYPEAIAAFEADVAIDRTAFALSDLGYAYAIADRREEALAILRELEEKYQKRESLGQYVALVHLGFGDLDQAFAWLEKDYQARSGLLDYLITDPLFDSIRGDPRYADLLRRMGLKP